jgi:signal transduction histidine kinase
VQEGAHILEEAVQCLRDAMNEVRRLSGELRPSTLDDLGLIPTVEAHCRKYEDAYSNAIIERNLFHINKSGSSGFFSLAKSANIRYSAGSPHTDVSIAKSLATLLAGPLDLGGCGIEEFR